MQKLSCCQLRGYIGSHTLLDSFSFFLFLYKNDLHNEYLRILLHLYNINNTIYIDFVFQKTLKCIAKMVGTLWSVVTFIF